MIVLKAQPPRRAVLFVVAALLATVAAGWYWIQSGTRRSAENASVNARIIQVASLVAGPIARVAVAENQHVDRGDVLFEIDRRPFEAALREAELKLQQAQQEASELAGAQASADRLSAEAFGNDAAAALESARAAVARARSDLEHAVARAAESGRVTNLDLATGTVVSPGTPLFAIVVDQSFWIDAKFKHTELAGIRPGRPARVVVDMYPDHEFHGVVESVAAGGGAPANGAAGKAGAEQLDAERTVPVRIRIDDPDPDFPLRVGATASVTVVLR